MGESYIIFIAFFWPFGFCSSIFPAFPACFRGLEREIYDFKQSTPFALFIAAEIAIPAYPERVLTGFSAPFQLIGNVQGL